MNLKTLISDYKQQAKQAQETKDQIFSEFDEILKDNEEQFLKKNIQISTTLTAAISQYLATFTDIPNMDGETLYVGIDLNMEEENIVVNFLTDRYQTIRLDIEDKIDIKELIHSIVDAKIQIMNYRHKMMTMNPADLT